MRGLYGKVAIVTGAAAGIGKAIAERLTEEGALVVWADIDGTALERVCPAEGHWHQANTETLKSTFMMLVRLPGVLREHSWPCMQVDMSHEAEVEQLVGRALQWHGRVDILVNNAARFVFNVATEVTDEGGYASSSPAGQQGAGCTLDTH